MKKITDKHFRQTVVSLTRYIIILTLIFLAYLFLANYVLYKSEQVIGFNGVYNYTFEMRQNYVHIRFNTLDPTASMVKFTDGTESIISATKDFKRFHEHIAALKPDREYTMTIDIKSKDNKKYTYKTEKIETRAVSITEIKIT